MLRASYDFKGHELEGVSVYLLMVQGWNPIITTRLKQPSNSRGAKKRGTNKVVLFRSRPLLVADPGTQKRISDREHDRADENADQPESEQAADDPG